MPETYPSPDKGEYQYNKAEYFLDKENDLDQSKEELVLNNFSQNAEKILKKAQKDGSIRNRKDFFKTLNKELGMKDQAQALAKETNISLEKSKELLANTAARIFETSTEQIQLEDQKQESKVKDKKEISAIKERIEQLPNSTEEIRQDFADARLKSIQERNQKEKAMLIEKAKETEEYNQKAREKRQEYRQQRKDRTKKMASNNKYVELRKAGFSRKEARAKLGMDSQTKPDKSREFFKRIRNFFKR